MTRRPTKYDDDVPVFPGINGVEFYVEDHSTEGRLVEDGIVLVDDDGIVGELVNPYDKPGKYGREQLFRFGFGTVGTTFLLVWARGVESGLEIAAGWLETNAPGHLMVHSSEELKQLYDEAREELGEDADEEEIDQQATADLTYTESGYLTSYEWTVDDVTDKKLVEAAVYASDLANFRFHATAGSGVDIVEGMDVYFFMNPGADGSSFWSVEGSKDGADKTSVIVLANGESHAERTSHRYLDRVFGDGYVTLADEIDDSEDLYWPLAAISEWVREGKKGPFELLPKVGEQTANARHRGIYAGTGAQEDDFVIHEDHRGRLVVDLVQRGGTHLTIGPTRGYGSEEEAKTAAREEAHRRDIRAGVLFRADKDGELHQIGHVNKLHEANARAQSGGHPIPASKGGGVVVVYIHKDGDWTAVFSGGQWDKEARRGMHQMYGSHDGWTDGHAGSHLGKKMRWEDLPEHIRRRVESQLGDMRSNARHRRRNSGSGSLTANSMQPFRGDQLVLIEKRDRHGKLDFSEPQPPHRPMKFDAVYRLYFDSDSSGDGSWESLKAWLDRRSWQLRAKTW